MAVRLTEAKQYVCTLTTGWRFTLPSSLRTPRGWSDGLVLTGVAQGSELYLIEKGEEVPDILADATAQDCYLGSGGKLVVPASLRSALKWSIGRKLAVTSALGAIKVAPCCHARQCRSCGEVQGVKEIISGLYLCPDCWSKYVTEKRRDARLRGDTSSIRSLTRRF
jgi:bifunctional DNA-binding transcriptional regulator/antitoxin component of YhaV-PrlF toxin-antitoxin module